MASDYEIIEHDDLSPCPFCGDNNPRLVQNNRLYYKVLCNSFGCYAQYGWCTSEKLAIDGWNERK